MLIETQKSAEQKSAEAEVEGFREHLGPFVVAAETTQMPMIFTDAKEPANPIIFANESFLNLTGYSREEVLGQRFSLLVERDADRISLAQVKATFAGSADSDPKLRYRRKDGSLFWAAIYISPVRDESGAIVQHFVSFIDLTEHKAEEERLRFFLDELNHRTQNMLATVQAIAAQTLRGAADEEVLETFEGRLLALSEAHRLLGRTNWAGVGVRDVLDQILQPFGLHDKRVVRFLIDGGEVLLPSKAALTLAMVFHELATNASKHGALSNGAAGLIDISWRVEPTAQGDQMRLRWRERGGPAVTPPTGAGFGSRLIERGLARELNGEVHLTYEPAGVVCQIVMPVPGGSIHAV